MNLRLDQLVEAASAYVDKVMECYNRYMEFVVEKAPTYKQFMQNMELKMQDPDMALNYLATAETKPSLLLNGEQPRLIDEWQLVPKLWDAVRFEVDCRDDFGQFILTGSSVPADMSKVVHSGTGRIGWLKMRSMSLWESQESTGEISLGELFAAPDQVGGISKIEMEQLAFLTCRGGWPLSRTGGACCRRGG